MQAAPRPFCGETETHGAFSRPPVSVRAAERADVDRQDLARVDYGRRRPNKPTNYTTLAKEEFPVYSPSHFPSYAPPLPDLNWLFPYPLIAPTPSMYPATYADTCITRAQRRARTRHTHLDPGDVHPTPHTRTTLSRAGEQPTQLTQPCNYTVVHHYRYTRVHHFRYEHGDDSTPLAPR
jgi:hypothetical protein